MFRRLDVDRDEIEPRIERLDRGVGLALIVGVELARRTLDGDAAEPGKRGDAVAEGHGGDDGAALSVGLREGRELGGGALRPEPDAVAGQLALGDSGPVYRMPAQIFVRQLHEAAERICVLVAGGNIVPHALAEVIVGRAEAEAPDVSPALHGDMAVRQRRLDGDARFARRVPEFRDSKEPFDELLGLISLYAAAAVGEDALFLKRDVLIGYGGHVAAEGRVARSEAQALGGCFERGAPGIALMRVASEYGKNGRVAPGREPVGAVLDAADEAAARKRVYNGLLRSLQRRPASELGDGIVRHAVA